jgi:uncharacterized protein
MSLWFILLAPFIGLLLTVFGAGGGMLTVPLLMHGFHLPLKSAIAASLWVVASVSLLSLLRQKAWHTLDMKLLAVFAAGGLVGSWSGAQLGLHMSDALQGGIFGLLVLFVAWWMHHPKPDRSGAPEGGCRCTLAAITGLFLGIATGMLGVGGGFLMVPALIWLGISDYKLAVRHSLVLIVLNASFAGLTYLGRVELAWQPMFWIAGLAAVGNLLGYKLMDRFSSAHLQTLFSILLVLVGGIMLYGAIGRPWH